MCELAGREFAKETAREWRARICKSFGRKVKGRQGVRGMGKATRARGAFPFRIPRQGSENCGAVYFQGVCGGGAGSGHSVDSAGRVALRGSDGLSFVVGREWKRGLPGLAVTARATLGAC